MRAIWRGAATDDDECTEHKPKPFPYLLAADKLGVQPGACLAFEDSLSGIRSAQQANMLVIAVKNAANKDAIRDAGGIDQLPVWIFQIRSCKPR